MASREFRCAACNQAISKEEFFEGLRKDAEPRGYGQPVCGDCLKREAQGLPIERHGDGAQCEDLRCPAHPHAILCEDCREPVLAGDRRGPTVGSVDYDSHREQKDGQFLHSGIHYGCTNERAHAKLKRGAQK